MDTAYINFLRIIKDSSLTNPARSLDNTERQLLEYILMAYDKGESLLVGDVIVQSMFGSQATLHGRIKILVRLGFLKLILDPLDARKRFVVPTILAKNYSKYMSNCLAKALKRSSSYL
jgi:hypothetical protein